MSATFRHFQDEDGRVVSVRAGSHLAAYYVLQPDHYTEVTVMQLDVRAGATS